MTRSRSMRHAVLQLGVVAVLFGAVQLVVVLDGPPELFWFNLLVSWRPPSTSAPGSWPGCAATCERLSGSPW